MSQSERPAAEVIDEVRAQWKADEIFEATAVAKIRGVVRVTDQGALDLLHGGESARTRYAAALSPERTPDESGKGHVA